MQVRHFDVAPGGYSSLERHEHEHYVIISHGYGTVIVGREAYEAHEGDVIYVPANTAHQFVNEASASGPLGFYCVVSTERDRPRLLDEEELRALDGTPAGAAARHRLSV
ncbi:cupin domain-containing protein [bacterium]|nr:MAG: cupin domain-containing protein [bacterium]